MANLGTLAVNLTANANMMQSGLAKAQRSISSFSSKAEGSLGLMGASIGAAVGNIAANAVSSAFSTAIEAGHSAMQLGEHFISTAASAEQLRVQLNVLAGSAQKGTKLFADLERFAMATSFSFEDVVGQARTFMALGIKDSDVVDTMTLIGTLAMGDTERMKLLGKAYTDTMSKGALRAQEMNQFAENNVNVMGALMAATGKSSEELLRMREAGEITFTDLHNALVGLTTGQGQFAGLLESMMQTTTGRWQSFQEQLDMISREFGEKLLPHANKFLDFLDESMPKIEQFGATTSSAVSDMIDKFTVLAQVTDERLLPALEKMDLTASSIADNVAGLTGFGFAQQIGERIAALAEDQKRFNELREKFGPRQRPKPRANSGIGEIKPIAEAAAGPAFVPSQSPLVVPFTNVGLPMFNLLGEMANETERLLEAADAAMVQTPEQRKQEEEKIARRTGGSLLQQGSQEAFSAIINAMRGNKDPNVQATNNVAHILANEVVPAMEAVAINTAGNQSAVVELVG